MPSNWRPRIRTGRRKVLGAVQAILFPLLARLHRVQRPHPVRGTDWIDRAWSLSGRERRRQGLGRGDGAGGASLDARDPERASQVSPCGALGLLIGQLSLRVSGTTGEAVCESCDCHHEAELLATAHRPCLHRIRSGGSLLAWAARPGIRRQLDLTEHPDKKTSGDEEKETVDGTLSEARSRVAVLDHGTAIVDRSSVRRAGLGLFIASRSDGNACLIGRFASSCFYAFGAGGIQSQIQEKRAYDSPQAPFVLMIDGMAEDGVRMVHYRFADGSIASAEVVDNVFQITKPGGRFAEIVGYTIDGTNYASAQRSTSKRTLVLPAG